jgi:hypothetical protein
MFETAEYHFYGALSHAASCDSAFPDQQAQHFEALAEHHKQLETWAKNCPENFENRAALVGASNAVGWAGNNTALFVVKIRAIRQIPMHGPEAAEKSRFAALVRELQAAVSRIKHLVFHQSILPDFAEGLLRSHIENLEFEFKQMLDAFAECFRQGDCRRELPTLRGALAGMDAAVEQIRHSTSSQRYEPEEALRAGTSTSVPGLP